MAHSKNVQCEQRDCKVSLPMSEMEVIKTLGNTWIVCPTCFNSMENSTGYCGIGCQLGYGCDHSC